MRGGAEIAMEEKTIELTCIQCPMGCALTVTVGADGVSVSGNSCPRGAAYGEKEVTHPTRIVTSSVVVDGGEIARVSVKTASDIPKEKIFDIMDEIRSARVKAPVEIGDIILSDAAGTGVDVIATKAVAEKGFMA